jgi:hypothetical protein
MASKRLLMKTDNPKGLVRDRMLGLRRIISKFGAWRVSSYRNRSRECTTVCADEAISSAVDASNRLTQC